MEPDAIPASCTKAAWASLSPHTLVPRNQAGELMDMRKWLTALLTAAMLLAAAPPVRAAGPDIAAPSAILMDAATGTVLYEKNASERLRPASVTKVMTLLLVMEALDTGRIGWDDTVIASEAA